jgi:hypothetical protein
VCKANSSSSATRSPPPRCGRSCTPPGSIPHCAGRSDWKQFLTAQARGILAVDFVHAGTVLLRRIYALIVIGHGTRLAEHWIRKQVLGGLTHEYQIAARRAALLREEAGHRDHREFEPHRVPVDVGERSGRPAGYVFAVRPRLADWRCPERTWPEVLSGGRAAPVIGLGALLPRQQAQAGGHHDRQHVSGQVGLLNLLPPQDRPELDHDP